MDRETEVELIREIIGLADQKATCMDAEIAHSPISRYSSRERFERERALVFRRQPMIVAHRSEIVGPRAFVTRDFLGLPILLARDDNGTLRAFLNVCRHRGAQLERESSGCKRVFTCPYHAWSWTNEGQLRAVPQEAEGFPELPRAERGLRRLPVAEKHGFVWIIADPDVRDMPDISAHLAGMGADFKWLGLDDSRIAEIEAVEIAANWKVLFEGGLEAYHFRIAHKNTIADFFPDNLSSYQMFGPHIRIILPRNSMPDLREVPEQDWAIRRDANILYSLTPTTQMLAQQDHVMWFHYEPLSVDRTRIRMATLVPQDAPDTEEMAAHWAKNQQITVTALMEDFALGEEIQAGFASKGNPSHLFGRFEGALNRFNLAVEDMLTG